MQCRIYILCTSVPMLMHDQVLDGMRYTVSIHISDTLRRNHAQILTASNRQQAHLDKTSLVQQYFSVTICIISYVKCNFNEGALGSELSFKFIIIEEEL